MAEEDNEEQRSDEQEPTSVDWSSSPGEQSRPTDEEDSSPAGADEPAERPAPVAAPSDEPDADGVSADDDSSPPAESDAEADEPDRAEVMVELPAGGGLPTSLLLAVLAAAVVLFLVALFACVHVWSGAAEEASALATGLTPADEGEEQPLPSAELLAGLTYSELTESARHCVTGADYERAAVLYAAAAEREEEGLPKALLARYKLAGALTLGARYGEAIHVVESLQAVSRPGDELWKNAVIAAVRIHQARKSRADFDRGLHLLRANSHRYGDEQALNRWLAYVEAMAGVEDVLARSEDSRSVYGVEPPPFGRAPYQGRPLAAEEIVPVSGKYGDGSLQVSCRLGEVRLRAEAAPLRDTLDAVADAAGIQIECDVPAQYVVVADIEGVTPQQCLETVLGSVGLALEGEGDRFVARSPQPRVESARQALESALWGLQEFLILCPDSPQLPEAYYALGHLHMTQGQRQMALDQLGVLTREFPLSSWTVYARYVQGRASCDQQDWQRGEQELLFVADSCSDASLARSAFLWAAHCQRERGEYRRAVSCFRRALGSEIDGPLDPSVLYNIAFCLEKSGASPLEAEQRYMELRTRFPDTEYAREADYRLARMVLETGDYWKAASRYEVYLERWPADDERGRRACADLLLCYVRSCDYARAVVLGEVMRQSFGTETAYCEVLPLIVEAYDKGRMRRIGLRAIESSLAVVRDPKACCYLGTEKARLQAELNMAEAAAETLAGLAGKARTAEQKARVRLVEAALLMNGGEPDRGSAICREVAQKCADRPLRERALRMLGAHYHATKQFDKAALAYSGCCPPGAEGELP